MRNKPIFAYSSGPNFGQIGDFYVDIRIFKSGTMFIKYPYDIHPIYLKTRYKLKEETINKISTVIEKDFDYINNIENENDKKLVNHCLNIINTSSLKNYNEQEKNVLLKRCRICQKKEETTKC